MRAIVTRAKLIAENIRRAAHGEPPVHPIPASAELAVPCATSEEDLRRWTCR
jgi:hypothetical protein